ncbi:MAG: LacI family DNA-binding transcriptional regulator [Candidatus Omnitrophota bacterium]
MVTLKKIADDLGVSVAAVSYVANNKWREKRIHRRLAEKISRKLKKEDYQPSILGRQLKTKRTQTIGVILGDLTRNFNMNILAGVEKVLAAADYFALVSSSDLGRKEITQFKTLLARSVEGIILSPITSGEDMSALFSGLIGGKVPVVLVDNHPPQWETDFVVSDNFAGSCEAVSVLLKKGFRKIAYVGYRGNLSAQEERFQGYVAALKSCGIKPSDTLVCRDIPSPGLTYKALATMFAKEVPDALFTESLQYFKEGFQFLFERKLNIPDDIMVTGFDPADVTLQEMNASFLPFVGTSHIPFIEQDGMAMGEKSARILLKKINGEGDGISRIFLKPHLKYFGTEEARE